jgi:biopolymer transport protein ExbB/TolQ
MFNICFNSLQADGCGLGLEFLWRSMGALGRGDVTLLALMLVDALVIVSLGLYRHGAARRQSRAFVRDAATALRDGRLDEVISIAARNPRSHVAAVVADGLTAFSAAPPQFTDAEAIAAPERAIRRRRKMLAADLKLGIGTLSTIASSAPFIGLLGTVFGISNAFVGTGGSRSGAIAYVAVSMAEALVTAAMGIAVAIPAVWCRNYLCDRVAMLDNEMSNAALEAVTYLHAHCDFRHRPGRSATETTGLFFRLPQDSWARSWEVRYDRQWALLLTMWYCMFYIAFILAQGMYQSYLWDRSWERESEARARISRQVGGQELISPDRRYRAMVPVIFREPAHFSGNDGFPHWQCGSESMVTLRIVPNDRPLAWQPHPCLGETIYALESDEALLTWNCSVPLITWRSNNELLIKCDDCSTDNVELAKTSLFPDRITLLGPEGKQIFPQVTNPRPQCLE